MHTTLSGQITQIKAHMDVRFDSMGGHLQEIIKYMQQGDAKKGN